MRIHRLMLAALILYFPSMARAEYADVHEAFNQLNQCVQQPARDCRAWLTKDSGDLYARFAGYGLMPCLPRDATYISEQPEGTSAVATPSITAKGKPRNVHLRFMQEAGAWKLDVP